MRENTILTFDLGTTRLKVAAFTPKGELIAQVSRRHENFSDGRFAWQEADAWWRDCTSAVRELTQTHVKPEEIDSISLAGRAGAAVFLDSHGNVLEDPWHDTRHDPELTALRQQLGKGVPAYALALLAKFSWLENNRPEVSRRVSRALYGKDFLMYRLTGEAVTDPSSGPDGEWQSAWLDAAGMDLSQVPQVKMPWQVAGTLTKSAATDLGLREDIPVATGAHDGICANTGCGAIHPNRMALTLGTHCPARVVLGHMPHGAFRFYSYPPDKHVIGGNALMAGRALDWFLDTFSDAPEPDRRQLFREMDEQIALLQPGAGGVSFGPFLGGRLSPQRRPDDRAHFHGMHANTTRADMYRAVMEGASFAIAEMVSQVDEFTGSPRQVAVTGSGMQSDVWTQMLADILERPLHLTDAAAEGRGAAIFSATARGYYPSVKDAVSNMVRITTTIEPEAARTETYREVMARWRSIVASLASVATPDP